MKAIRTVSESGGLSARHIDAFLDRLRTAHYSEVRLRKKTRLSSKRRGSFELCNQRRQSGSHNFALVNPV